MNILFIHQNYPAQYKHILNWLAKTGDHKIVFLTQKAGLSQPKDHHIIEYLPDHMVAEIAYPYSTEFEKCCTNGAKVADVCRNLEGQGFKPDIVLGHTGWGEMLFLKELWPDIPILSYFEYFYCATGGAVGFDPEFPISEAMPYIMNARNAVNHLSYEACDVGQTATHWQKKGYPTSFHNKMNVIHEGIRTDICKPNAQAQALLGRMDKPITHNDEIFTYMARNMEPVRGFHIFMRSLPKILKARPNARVLIIGGNQVSYGRPASDGHSYRGMLELEVGDHIDWSRVHFLGRVEYEVFVAIMQMTRAHIYLTVPFVPSWSMMEAMSIGATVISSNVAPVKEIIQDGKTGFLVDFLNADALADKTIDVLNHHIKYREIGVAAREHIVSKYDFNSVILPKQIKMINSILPMKSHIGL